MTLLLSDRSTRVRRPAKAPPTSRSGVKEKDIDLNPILRARAEPAAEAVSTGCVIGNDPTEAHRPATPTHTDAKPSSSTPLLSLSTDARRRGRGGADPGRPPVPRGIGACRVQSVA